MNPLALLRLQADYVRSPAETLRRIGEGRSAFVVGAKNVLFVAALYELAILLWYLGDARITLAAFLPIPEDRYYLYELAFLVPVFFGTWILATGIVYAVSRALGSTRGIDALFGGIGLSISVSAYFTLVPDLIQGVMFATGWLPQAKWLELSGQGVWPWVIGAYLVGYVVSNVALYTMATRSTQGLSTAKSLVAATLGFLGYFSVFITYVR